MTHIDIRLLTSVILFFVLFLSGSLFNWYWINCHPRLIGKYRNAKETKTNSGFARANNASTGPVFAYGELNAVDAVSVPWAKDQYLFSRTILEKYKEYNYLVITQGYYDPRTCSYGPDRSENKTVYKWEPIQTDDAHATTVNFCGIDLPYKKIPMPDPMYFDTEQIDEETRYQYYILPKTMVGTLYTDFSDGDVGSCRFFEGIEPREAKKIMILEQLLMSYGWWVGWVLISIIVLVVYYKIVPQIMAGI